MVRAKKGQDVNVSDLNTIDLGKEMGLTLLSDSNSSNVNNVIPTGIPQYDKILGGGIPLGRFTDIYGKEQSGKSSFASYLSRVTTQLGIITIWIDVEGTADNKRLEQLGVDTTKLFSIQPGVDRLKNVPVLTVEKVGEELEHWITTFNDKYPGIPILFIWDSIANTMSKHELEGSFDDKKIGVKSASNTKMINKVTPLLNNTNTGLIIINQARDDFDAGFYGDDVKPTGGKALEHASSLRMLVAKGKQIKQPKPGSKYEEYVGHVMRIKTKKSKMSRPNQSAEAYLLSEYDLEDGTQLNGFDLEFNAFYEAKEIGLFEGTQYKSFITKKGEEVKLREKEWLVRLKEDRELYLDLITRIYAHHFPSGFAPLQNKNVDVTRLEEYQALEKHYAELEEENNKQEDQEEETKGESQEKDSE